MTVLNAFRDLTEEEVIEALTYLDAGCAREDWVRIGMAIKAEFGQGGFAIFDDWSKQAGAKYSTTDTRDTWKSIKPTGGITIATLIHEAQQFGFSLNEALRQPISQEEIAARRMKRQAEEEAHRLEREQRMAQAAQRANELWTNADDLEGDGFHYLKRKQVQAFGVKFGRSWRNGAMAMLVPMRNIDGQLVSLQAYFENELAEIGRDRDYLPGGQRRGSFHLIGSRPSGANQVIVVCEGYSTGASIYQATGWPVAVAFDAGNLVAVARAMRQLCGAATIIIAADNDQWNKDGNAGMHHGHQAASAAGAILIAPKFEDLKGQPTDFNDLHVREGLDAVRQQLMAAIPVAANDNHLDLGSSVNPFMFPHLSDRQQPLNTWENLAWMLEQYGITAKYNQVKKDIIVTIPGRTYGMDSAANCALAEINSLCSRNRMPSGSTADYLKLIGNMNSVNPAADFILSRPWDGISRLPALFDTLKTGPGFDRSILRLLVRRWLISAVAAAMMNTGFWSKGVLVLQGEQSLGKTAWVKALLPAANRDMIKIGASIDPTNKDTIASAIGHWIVELGELDGTFRKADIAKLKAFISQDIDMMRRPYDRLESSYQRRTVFFASVNPERFLADDTGNVRWWTIPVVDVDYQHDIDVQQLWAEVLTLFRAGERWWLDRQEEALLEGVNREHEAIDPLEELLLARFSWNMRGTGREMTATEVLLAVGYDRPSKGQATDCSRLLQKLTGGKPRKSGSRRLFHMPPEKSGFSGPAY